MDLDGKVLSSCEMRIFKVSKLNFDLGIVRCRLPELQFTDSITTRAGLSVRGNIVESDRAVDVSFRNDDI